ncbi:MULTISPECIES: DUF6745 domain-containing protein [Aerosakkonema]|uniref:DUF6745 domain-containing protein n=1 Tax=Aerosakkonema TaxID=1246629 RepID=UPI0035BAE2A3
MSPTRIDKLTLEQEALIPIIRQKWRAIALSTKRIDRKKAAAAVRSVYELMGKKEPKIVFCESPYAAMKIAPKTDRALSSIEVINYLYRPLRLQLRLQIGERTSNQLWHKLEPGLGSRMHDQLRNQLQKHINSEFVNCIEPQLWVSEASWLEFCISILRCDRAENIWSVFQSLVKHCSWIYLWEDICILSDRPVELFFDNQNRLHAEGKPAVQFGDGYCLYSHHGVTLPEKYGVLHPHQWQAEWLLSEENAEIRRVLIQGIGYGRISQELQFTKLDDWREYTLLKIDNNIDVEPIYLLKMTCPSTAMIHTLRVPPNFESAKEAIRWVNWGITPEKFSLET